MNKTIGYFRVSTRQQQQSGLGLEAQRDAVDRYATMMDGEVIESYTETESGKQNNRPELSKALSACELTGATLVISKLDRLSRNAAFLLKLRDSGVRFIAADMPDANETTVGIMAVLAEDERKRISRRTKEALAVAKRRLEAEGRRLGNPNGAEALRRAGKGNAAAIEAISVATREYAMRMKPVIQELNAMGVVSLRDLSRALTKRHIQTRRGGKWHPSTVSGLIKHIAALE